MPTSKLHANNRLNSPKTTGLCRAAGKATSQFTALLRDVGKERAQIAAELRRQYRPSNPAETFLVEILIKNELRLRNLYVFEAALWEIVSSACLAEASFATAYRDFFQVQCVIDTCQDNYYYALEGLHRLRAVQPQPARSRGKLIAFPGKAQGVLRKSQAARPNPPAAA